MNMLKELLYECLHALHSFRHNLAGHRLLKYSVKPPGKWFYRVQHMECECGKVFATVKDKNEESHHASKS